MVKVGVLSEDVCCWATSEQSIRDELLVLCAGRVLVQ